MTSRPPTGNPSVAGMSKRLNRQIRERGRVTFITNEVATFDNKHSTKCPIVIRDGIA